MTPDTVANKYNLLRSDQYALFDHRVPVDRFVELLGNRDVPETVCVTGLGETLAEGDPTEVSQALQVGTPYLEREPQPTIQFAVDGKFHSIPNGFELMYDEDFHNLNQLFGPTLKRKQSGWLVADF